MERWLRALVLVALLVTMYAACLLPWLPSLHLQLLPDPLQGVKPRVRAESDLTFNRIQSITHVQHTF